MSLHAAEVNADVKGVISTSKEHMFVFKLFSD